MVIEFITGRLNGLECHIKIRSNKGEHEGAMLFLEPRDARRFKPPARMLRLHVSRPPRCPRR
jgi:hypothetical protein